MGARRTITALLVAAALGGCSLLGLGETPPPTCTRDAECAALPLGDLDCERAVCLDGLCAVRGRDDDADGYVREGCPRLDGSGEPGDDCADDDPDVHPGAEETCNGLDDNCNGDYEGAITTMDGRSDGEDDDGDGQFDVCAGPAASDCDDTAETGGDTWVGAPELCDGYDNDCVIDGELRFSGGQRREPGEDDDGDGFVVVGATCEGGDLGIDDCDDARDDVYPGAFEACDGVDNDCDGVVDGTAPRATGSACIPLSVAVGQSHSCLLRPDGDVVCWGSNRAGALGDPAYPDDAAVRVPGVQRATQITVGAELACAVDEDGAVWCWGREWASGVAGGSSDEYGFGRVALSGPARHVAAGDLYEICAALEDGGVECWGYVHCGGAGPSMDEATALGLLETDPESPCMLAVQSSILPRAIELPAGFDAVEVQVATQRACARSSDGRVACWGMAHNSSSSLGDGVAVVSRSGVEVSVGGAAVTDATAMALTRHVDCILREGGALWCWGQDGSGAVAEPFQVMGALPAFESLHSSVDVSCALDASGTPYCWGQGSPANADSIWFGAPTVALPVTEEAVDLALSNGHTCALVRDEGIRCWGSERDYYLGDGRAHTTDGSATDAELLASMPQPVSVAIPVLSIHAGFDATCFRLPDQTVRCQGGNHEVTNEDKRKRLWTDRDLRDRTPNPLPAARQSFPAAIDVAVGANRHQGQMNWQGRAPLCVVVPPDPGTAESGLVCRGGADWLQRGLEDLTDAERVVAGDRFVCALRRGGRVRCAGFADRGRLGALGAGTFCPASDREICESGVDVAGLGRVVAVGAGDQHACALDDEGIVRCWGASERGQLGSRPVAAAQLPRPVTLPSPVVQLAVGGRSACVTTDLRETYCWGDVVAEATAPNPVPTRVPAFAGAIELALTKGAVDEGDPDTVCARFVSGQVRCMGDGTHGELGHGMITTGAVTDPVLVSDLPDAASIECGGNHCCAVRTSGQAVCWGSNDRGQLGNGTWAMGAVVSSPRSVVSLLRANVDPGLLPPQLSE